MTRQTRETLSEIFTSDTEEESIDSTSRHSLFKRVGASVLSAFLAFQVGIPKATSDPEPTDEPSYAITHLTTAEVVPSTPDPEEPTALELALVGYKELALTYDETSFVYLRENVPAFRDAERKQEVGLPFALAVPLELRERDVPFEDLSESEKITEFFEAMNEVYTHDPAAFAAVKLLLESRMGGQKVTDETLKQLAESYKADADKWKGDYEAFIESLFNSQKLPSIGFVGPGEFGSFYEIEGRIVELPVSNYGSETLDLESVTLTVGDDGIAVKKSCPVRIKGCVQTVTLDECDTEKMSPEEEMPKTPFGTPYTPENDPPVITPQPLPPFIPLAPVPPRPVGGFPQIPPAVIPGPIPVPGREVIVPTRPKFPEQAGRGTKDSKYKSGSVMKLRGRNPEPAYHRTQPTYINDGAGKTINRGGRNRRSH